MLDVHVCPEAQDGAAGSHSTCGTAVGAEGHGAVKQAALPAGPPAQQTLPVGQSFGPSQAMTKRGMVVLQVVLQRPMR